MSKYENHERFSSSIIHGRRDWLRASAGGILGMSGWLGALAAQSATDPSRKRSCILLWMSGGPSQLDTFDPKPGHANGGLFKPLQTSVEGIHIGEHLPQLAKQAQRLAIIRSMNTKEGDHGRATFLAHTGNLPQPPIRFPTFGSFVAKERHDPRATLPSFVSISPYRVLSAEAFSPGFLGSGYAPLIVGESSGDNGGNLQVEDLASPEKVAPAARTQRLKILSSLEERFASGYKTGPVVSHRIAYERALRLMSGTAARAFDLDDEPDHVRDRYGRNPFGQGCLLARRLVERGVPFIEVAHTGNGGLGWDTHTDNFENVRRLCNVLDPAWATLMDELQQRGLLDSTLIVWMGEFGRTPNVNENGGRDHYPNAWSTVLAGGGIRGGQVVGKTSADGTTVVDRPVTIPDFLATVCLGLGIDPATQNDSNVGRPIRLVDASAHPLREVLG